MADVPNAQSPWEFRSCNQTKIKRVMTVSERKLLVHFKATEARFRRASFSAFVDVLTLATKTIEEFGQGMEL